MHSRHAIPGIRYQYLLVGVLSVLRPLGPTVLVYGILGHYSVPPGGRGGYACISIDSVSDHIPVLLVTHSPYCSPPYSWYTH